MSLSIPQPFYPTQSRYSLAAVIPSHNKHQRTNSVFRWAPDMFGERRKRLILVFDWAPGSYVTVFLSIPLPCPYDFLFFSIIIIGFRLGATVQVSFFRDLHPSFRLGATVHADHRVVLFFVFFVTVATVQNSTVQKCCTVRAGRPFFRVGLKKLRDSFFSDFSENITFIQVFDWAPPRMR